MANVDNMKSWGLRDCDVSNDTKLKCEGKTWRTVTAPNFLYYVLAFRTLLLINKS